MRYRRPEKSLTHKTSPYSWLNPMCRPIIALPSEEEEKNSAQYHHTGGRTEAWPFSFLLQFGN